MSVDFYREMHEKEFERRESLLGRSSALIAALTTLGGMIGFLVVGYKGPGGWPDHVFWTLIVVAALAVAIAASYLCASYTAPPLLDLDKPSVWRTYLRELTAEYKAAPGAFPSAQEEFDDHVITMYAQTTDQNIAINTQRGYRLVKCNFAVLGAFVLVVLAALAYYYGNSLRPAGIDMQKVAQMLSNDESLVCIPTGSTLEAATKPGTRPVPSPHPGPVPAPSKPRD